MLRSDLHTHSTASDGALPPAALVEAATAAGLGLLALTDHDTVAGLAEARRAAAASGLVLVDGIELSALWNGTTLHVLGLGIDPAAPALTAALAGQAEARHARADQIAAKLTKLGHGAAVAHARAAVAASAHPQGWAPAGRAYAVALTRTHFAQALVATGAAGDFGEAFDRWLGRGRPGYVRGAWCSLDAACALIVAAGGHASLAHPLRYRLSGGALRRLVDAFRAAGGAALEVVSGRAAKHQVEALATQARRAALAATAGSDFHAPGARWAALGELTPLPAGVEDLALRLGTGA
jgi:predicted metal-dependent phosphoesterase TrpH